MLLKKNLSTYCRLNLTNKFFKYISQGTIFAKGTQSLFFSTRSGKELGKAVGDSQVLLGKRQSLGTTYGGKAKGNLELPTVTPAPVRGLAKLGKTATVELFRNFKFKKITFLDQTENLYSVPSTEGNKNKKKTENPIPTFPPKSVSIPPSVLITNLLPSVISTFTKVKAKERSNKQKPLNNFYKNNNYYLETYHRSNQDTCLIHKPSVKEGDWIENGDLLADSASSMGGELAIGHNIIVAYMPWEGYNYEDAILINERLVYDDIYTSIHIEKYEIETKDTKLGPEQITNQIPDTTQNELAHLDKNGIAKIGSWIEEGDILVGKVTPFNIKAYTPNEKFIFELFNKKPSPTKDSSLRAPKGIKANVIKINILARQKYYLSSKKSSKEKKAKTSTKTQTHLLPKGISTKENSKSKSTTFTFTEGKNKQKKLKATSTKVQAKENVLSVAKKSPPSKVYVYLAEKRKIQVGDKMAGRHGNKGIVSRILPRQDMPFLPDGTPVDIVLNPLGVPSRMNVGQIYECLLGLAGRYLGEHYKIPPFDELYGAEASRSFVFSKLYEARKKTSLEWLFDPNSPGKMRLFDGRNSECFDQTVTVGIAYILKLVHMVDDKITARSTGPYSLVTQQPLRGRSKQGGQRLGEMEVWAIEGYGAAFVLSEMLTIKSDNMAGRQALWVNLINNRDISLGTPESFKVLVCELQALCLDIGLFVHAFPPFTKVKAQEKGNNRTNISFQASPSPLQGLGPHFSEVLVGVSQESQPVSITGNQLMGLMQPNKSLGKEGNTEIQSGLGNQTQEKHNVIKMFSKTRLSLIDSLAHLA